jgi:hypothetical protein
MKYIFLDIDGVMNHKEYVMSHPQSDKPLCPSCVTNLKRILLECDAKIVVSSTWRKGYKTTEQMKNELFAPYGLEMYVEGRTPVMEDAERGDEIAWYMKEHNIEESDIVILDDDTDMGALRSRLVQTHFMYGGLTEEKRDEAIIRLKS